MTLGRESTLHVDVYAGSRNLSDDGSEDEDSQHEVDDNKSVLGVGDGQRQVSNGRHRQCRPEERVQVHSTERGVDRVQHRVNAVVDELIRPEPDPCTEQDEEAGVPVDDDEDVNDEVDDADSVREAALRLDSITELHGTNEPTRTTGLENEAPSTWQVW